MSTYRETAEFRAKIEVTADVEALRRFALGVLDSLFPPLTPEQLGAPVPEGEFNAEEVVDLDEDDDRQWGVEEIEYVSAALDDLERDITPKP